MNTSHCITRPRLFTILPILATLSSACEPEGSGDAFDFVDDDDESVELELELDDPEGEFRSGGVTNTALTNMAGGIFYYVGYGVAQKTLSSVLDKVFDPANDVVDLSTKSLQAIADIVDQSLQSAFFERDKATARSLVSFASNYVRSSKDFGEAHREAQSIANSADLLASHLQDYGLSAMQVYQLVSGIKVAFTQEVAELAELRGESASNVISYRRNVCNTAKTDLAHLEELRDELVRRIETRFSTPFIDTKSVVRSSGYGYVEERTMTGCYDGPNGRVCSTDTRKCVIGSGVGTTCRGKSEQELLDWAVDHRDSAFRSYAANAYRTTVGDPEQYCKNMTALVDIANSCEGNDVAFSCFPPRPPHRDDYWELHGAGDINGDGYDELIWQHDNGQVAYWEKEGEYFVYSATISEPAGADWELEAIGDVDGNGSDDLIWRHDSGVVDVWPMTDGSYQGSWRISEPVGSEWDLKGAGDVDGDGTDDIVWHHRNGQVHYWQMANGERKIGVDIGERSGGDWTVRGVADVDGDGTDDIVWRHESGQAQYWVMSEGTRVASRPIGHKVDGVWTLETTGDMNADGTDDLIWRHATGMRHYWTLDAGTYTGGGGHLYWRGH